MKFLLDKKDIPTKILTVANEISSLPGVKDMVCFPDLHLKEKYANLGYRIDIPSSLAILTENCFYPQFRSRGINCGMSLIRTNLFYQKELIPKLEEVLLGFNKGLMKNLFNYFRFPLKDKFSLSAEEFKRTCLEGADVIKEKFGFPEKFVFGKKFKFNKEELAEFNYSGISRDWQQGTLRLKRKMGRHFGGNHFLEFQMVDNIFNQKKADEWGIKKGQIYILYHTAGESLDSILEEKILSETIYQPSFIRLEKSSSNYRIILKAIKILMNYGFAYRLTTFAILNSLLSQVLNKEIELDYFVDRYHNGIEELEIDSNNTSLLYRHNVAETLENSPVILSGLFNLRSYVSEGEKGAGDFLWSSDHGYGNLIKKFPQKKDNNLKVKRILFKKGLNLPFFVKAEEESIEQNPAADYLLSLFEKHNISKKVFSLRPIINFKFVK